MEVMHAGWRSDYINGVSHETDKQQRSCIFCEYPKEDNDPQNLIIVRGEYSFVIMNRYPYSTGHLMIVPYRHTNDFTSLSTEEAIEITALSQRTVNTLRKVFQPDGFNLGMNLGRTAGAGIADHIHLHIVPRWNGDTNFMSVTAETKVLPEALSVTYERISKAWA